MNKRYFLSEDVVLRLLETPSAYHVKRDELYELNDDAFSFLKACNQVEGCTTDDKEFLDYCLSEGILTDIKQKPVKYTIRQSPVPSLRYLELLITDQCNLRCRHCYIGEPTRQELSLHEITSVLDEFEGMQGLRVLISGGEPLMYSEFERLNEYLRDYPLRIVLLTNGLLLTEKRLCNLSVDEIQISIDGIGSAHEAIRGKDTYQRTIDAMKRAIDHGFQVSVSTMIHSQNLDQFEEMEKLFRSLGVKEWTVDVPCMSGRMSEELFLPPEVAGRYLQYGYGGGFHGGAEGYGCGVHLVSVLPDGSVAKCAFYADRSVGHISEGLENCWKKLAPIKIDELDECKSCPFVTDCRGGCRFRAELLGNPEGKDLYKCHAFED